MQPPAQASGHVLASYFGFLADPAPLPLTVLCLAVPSSLSPPPALSMPSIPLPYLPYLNLLSLTPTPTHPPAPTRCVPTRSRLTWTASRQPWRRWT